jgi:hypothetical protein
MGSAIGLLAWTNALPASAANLRLRDNALTSAAIADIICQMSSRPRTLPVRTDDSTPTNRH